MKHFLLFFYIIFFLLFSCSKKEENNNEEKEDIVREIKTDQYYQREKQRIFLETNDIFLFDIFENIGETIEYYEIQPNFSIIDITPPKERELPDKEIIASSDEIIVHFIKWGNSEYRKVEVLKATEDNIFSKYIGLTREEIIEIFGPEKTPWPTSNLGYLTYWVQYIDKRYNFIVEFYYNKDDEEKIINKILYGDFTAFEY